VARLDWADTLQMSLTVSDWVDLLEGGKWWPYMTGVAGTAGRAVGP